jgi:SAM-dependent methyltransferase
LLNRLVRYAPVTAILEGVEGTTLLEVGSGSRGISAYLGGGWEVTAVDRDFGDYVGLADAAPAGVHRVAGDVAALPFPDASFDAVVALDLLEHVPPRERAAALRELARVARRVAIVGCPCGEPALESDRRLASWYDRLGVPRPAWLVEHLERGFPDAGLLRSELQQHGELRLVPNESVAAHERLGRVEALPVLGVVPLAAARLLRVAAQAPGTARGRVAGALLRRLRGRDRPPAYRTIAVLKPTR